jgi:hypothetical protein
LAGLLAVMEAQPPSRAAVKRAVDSNFMEFSGVVLDELSVCKPRLMWLHTDKHRPGPVYSIAGEK